MTAAVIQYERKRSCRITLFVVPRGGGNILKIILFDFQNFKFFARNFELDFKFSKGKSVNALGIVLIGGARILLQDFNECTAFFGRQFVE